MQQKFTMPDSPRTLFILHFSWVSKWLWKTVIVKESWKSSNDLRMRKNINILNMKYSGMIKLELHVSLQKKLMSTLQNQMFPTIKKMNTDNMKKIFLKSDRKHDCGDLLNPLPQICYILSSEGSASFWWTGGTSKILKKRELKEILDMNLMVTSTHSEPKQNCSEKIQHTLSLSDIFSNWYLFITILTQWISPKVYSECQFRKLSPMYALKLILFPRDFLP